MKKKLLFLTVCGFIMCMITSCSTMATYSIIFKSVNVPTNVNENFVANHD